MSEERGEYLTGEPQIVKCPHCGAVIGAVIEYQGEQYLAVGCNALLKSMDGICGTCDEPFRWRAQKKVTKAQGLVMVEDCRLTV